MHMDGLRNKRLADECTPERIHMIALALLLLLSGDQLFQKYCAGCHGGDAQGTAKGPGLSANPRVTEQSEEQLSSFIQQGNIANGMPSFTDLSAKERLSIAKYL